MYLFIKSNIILYEEQIYTKKYLSGQLVYWKITEINTYMDITNSFENV